MTDQSVPWWKNRTIRGAAPWVAMFAAMLAFDRLVEHRIITNGRDLAGLEDNIVYTYRMTPSLCVNQAVYAKLGERRYLRPIGAVEGQVVLARDGKVHIENAVIELGQDWTATALAEIEDNQIAEIAERHVLILNTNFDAKDNVNSWAIAVVPETDVSQSLSHVLMSRDLRRIGKPATELGLCKPRIEDI